MNKHLQAVGQILYATAICDGEMHPAEEDHLIASLNTYIQSFSSTTNKDEALVTNADNFLEEIKSQKLNPSEYFENFKNYYQGNPEEFVTERKNLILKSINSIASSYAKQNKSEIILVAKTRLLLSPL